MAAPWTLPQSQAKQTYGGTSPNGSQLPNAPTGNSSIDTWGNADPNWSPEAQQAWRDAVAMGRDDIAQQVTDKAWKEVDQRKAYVNSVRASAQSAAGSSTPAGYSRPIYDPGSGNWSAYDQKNKTWKQFSTNDLYGNLDEQTKAQYPEWYFGQQAQDQQDQKEYMDNRRLESQVGFAQQMGSMSDNQFKPSNNYSI